jgi:hypothetical protein
VTTADEPDQEHLLRLHDELVNGERTAPARMANLVLEPLVRRVRQGVSGIDEPQVRSTCCQTLARYLRSPEIYEPNRGPLIAWLVLDARGDVLNELTSARGRREIVDVATVELRGATGNVFTEAAELRPVEEEALDHADPYDVPTDVLASIREHAAALSPEDAAMIELMGEGVRETAAYAEVLGITHLPAQEQQAAVKREKDRLTRQLERLRERLA